MIFKGFKFGMLLQLAVGPVCVFIFNEGCNRGFGSAETGVAAVALVDALYIGLAILGIAKLLGGIRTQKVLMVFGAVIVGIFGLNIIGGTLGLTIIPDWNLFRGITAENAFLKGFILTVANPLTILFWAGVFSAKVAEERMIRQDLYLFGLGALGATGVFMSMVALAGNFTRQFLPGQLIGWLNFGVGLVLVIFAVRMVLKARKRERPNSSLESGAIDHHQRSK